MSVAIGPSFVSSSFDGHASRAALDAEVARYKKKLADCVNCPSTSSTPEGKAAIQELSTKISADQGRIRRIEAAPSVNDPGALAVKPAIATNTYTAAGAAITFTDTTQGGLVNAFA